MALGEGHETGAHLAREPQIQLQVAAHAAGVGDVFVVALAGAVVRKRRRRGETGERLAPESFSPLEPDALQVVDVDAKGRCLRGVDGPAGGERLRGIEEAAEEHRHRATVHDRVMDGQDQLIVGGREVKEHETHQRRPIEPEAALSVALQKILEAPALFVLG